TFDEGAADIRVRLAIRKRRVGVDLEQRVLAADVGEMIVASLVRRELDIEVGCKGVRDENRTATVVRLLRKRRAGVEADLLRHQLEIREINLDPLNRVRGRAGRPRPVHLGSVVGIYHEVGRGADYSDTSGGIGRPANLPAGIGPDRVSVL